MSRPVESLSAAAKAAEPSFGRLVDDLISRMQAGEELDWAAVEREHAAHAVGLQAVRSVLGVVAELSRSGGQALAGVAADADNADGLITGVLGDYRIVREVGRGGMGVVYEAEQVSLGRRVALKVLPFAATMDPKQLQRFKNEARAAGSLRHEHIVHVYGVGCDRGVHHYAMEFIDGVTLAHVIAAMRDGPADKPARPEPTADFHPARSGNGVSELAAHLPAARESGSVTEATVENAALSTQFSGPKTREFYRNAARLIADAADALEHAHSLGIVHRDIKPGNLLMDQSGKVYITDFGLARLGADASLTMSGDLLGMLRYMSPEQALARHGLVDHRADVYGLGATLYELLTGRPAVDGTDRADILRHLAFEDPTPLRKLGRAIPAELETITLKALTKNPAERYATAGEFADDLRRWLGHQTIKAKPPTMRQRTAKWARRHSSVVAATMVGLVLLLTASVTGSVLVYREKQQTQSAFDQARTAYTAAASGRRQALRALDLVNTRVISIWLQRKEALLVDERALLEAAAAEYERFTSNADDDEETRALTAAAFHNVGKIREKMGQKSAAETAYNRAVTQFERLVNEAPGNADYRTKLADCLYSQAMQLMNDVSRRKSALPVYRRSLAQYEKLAADQPTVVSHRFHLANNLLWMAQMLGESNSTVAEAAEVARRALPIAETVASEEPQNPVYQPQRARLLTHLSECLLILGQREEAEAAVLRAIDMLEALKAADPQSVKFPDFLEWAYRAHERVLTAKGAPHEEFERALCRRLAAAEENVTRAPRNFLTWRSLGEVQTQLENDYLSRRRTADALQVARAAAATNEKLFRSFPNSHAYHPNLVPCFARLAELERRYGNMDNGERALRQAIALVELNSSTTPGTDDRPNALVELYDALRTHLMATNQKPRAEEAFRRMLAVQEKIVAAHPKEPAEQHRLSHFLRGSAEPSPDDEKRALAASRRAVELKPDEPLYWIGLGVASYRTGDAAAAARALETARVKGKADNFGQCLDLALAHQKIGQAVEARRLYDRCIVLLTEHEAAQHKGQRCTEYRAALARVARELGLPTDDPDGPSANRSP
jgi:serine/threonine protein kinase